MYGAFNNPDLYTLFNKIYGDGNNGTKIILDTLKKIEEKVYHIIIWYTKSLNL